jgi:hypothetical protein
METKMKQIIAVVIISLFTASAIAACPIYAPYHCKPGPGGKQICGCGVR